MKVGFRKQRESSRGFYNMEEGAKTEETPNTNFVYFLILLSGAAVKVHAQCPRLCQYRVIHKTQILAFRFLTCVHIKYELMVLSFLLA